MDITLNNNLLSNVIRQPRHTTLIFSATTTRHSFIVYKCTPIYDTQLPLTFFNGKIKYIHCRSGVPCMGLHRKDLSNRKSFPQYCIVDDSSRFRGLICVFFFLQNFHRTNFDNWKKMFGARSFNLEEDDPPYKN